MTRIALALTALLAFSGPGVAQSLDPTQCYGRVYSVEHLASHPDQYTREIAFGPNADAPKVAGRQTFTLGVVVKGSDETFRTVAYCEPAGAGLSCGLEGDGGAFTIEPEAGGTALLTLGPDGAGFEGASDFIRIDPTATDDAAFRLYPGLCP